MLGVGLFLALALALPASQASIQGWQSGGSVGPRGLIQQPVISEAGGSFNSFLLLAGAAYFSGILGPRARIPPSSDSEDSDEEGLGSRPVFNPIPGYGPATAAWETLKESLGGYVKSMCSTSCLHLPTPHICSQHPSCVVHYPDPPFPSAAGTVLPSLCRGIGHQRLRAYH